MGLLKKVKKLGGAAKKVTSVVSKISAIEAKVVKKVDAVVNNPIVKEIAGKVPIVSAYYSAVSSAVSTYKQQTAMEALAYSKINSLVNPKKSKKPVPAVAEAQQEQQQGELYKYLGWV